MVKELDECIGYEYLSGTDRIGKLIINPEESMVYSEEYYYNKNKKYVTFKNILEAVPVIIELSEDTEGNTIVHSTWVATNNNSIIEFKDTTITELAEALENKGYIVSMETVNINTILSQIITAFIDEGLTNSIGAV